MRSNSPIKAKAPANQTVQTGISIVSNMPYTYQENENTKAERAGS
jgi:hypothetical protein